MAEFRFRSRFLASAERVFGWHEREGAFERLAPPWESISVLERHGGIRDGDRVTLEMRFGPLRQRWIAEHSDYIAGHSFRDTQLSGPFARWQHTHVVEADGDGAVLDDRIEYELPFGLLGRLGAGVVRRQLERTFAYRHRTTRGDLRAHDRCKGDETMNVLVTGSSGLVGAKLAPFLSAGGHDVARLRRGAAGSAGGPSWEPAAGRITAPALEGFGGVVHLAGENIAGGRWTAARKARIRDSRIDGTRLLAETLAGLEKPPEVLVSASAIGFYGDRGDDEMAEDSAAGSGFLAEVCREWEAATEPARAAGIRVVNLRIGVVLSPDGGALGKMLTPFNLGAGGKIGDGGQYMSWVAIDDLLGIIHHALITDSLSGPVNATSPEPVTNLDFTKTLGRVLGRPTILPMPAFAARAAFGEMADEMLLASTRVAPRRLQASGYEYLYPSLEAALRHVLGR